MPFSALGLLPPILHALRDRHYAAPTPVQAAAIPEILRGRDVWACAQTGSGKTAAYALPLLQHFAGRPRPTRRRVPVLILVPTRELATQVNQALLNYGRHLPTPAKVITAVGGVSINPQMMALRGGADLIVATPGRLLDLVEHNAVHLDAVETLVLDEADRLFALGFADELNRVLALLPPRRQNLLFSATFPPEVTQLAEALLQDPARIEVATTPLTRPAITERAIEVDAPRRTQLLRHLITTHGWTRVLVFVAKRYSTDHIAEKLRRLGIEAGALHGELSQGGRTQVLSDFNAGAFPVLVATDLAARGLDFVDLPVVVNYDLPRSAIIYTHRIGRTGRAGARGEAISFVSAATDAHFRLIEKRHDEPIVREQILGFEPVEEAPPPPPTTAPDGSPLTGGIKGKRKSKKDKLREAAARAAGTAPSAPTDASSPETTSAAIDPKAPPPPRRQPPAPARPEIDPPGFRWHRSTPIRRWRL